MVVSVQAQYVDVLLCHLSRAAERPNASGLKISVVREIGAMLAPPSDRSQVAVAKRVSAPTSLESRSTQACGAIQFTPKPEWRLNNRA
jgi:hypothetical protein